MQYQVVVTKHLDNGYTARPILFPEVVVTGTDEAETLDRMRTALLDVQSHSHIVAIDVPAGQARTPADPWLNFAGMWSNDPDWSQFLAEIADYRRLIDEQSPNIDNTAHG